MSKANHIRIPLSSALPLIGRYVGNRLREQVRAVAFISLYLFAFQVIIFGSTPENALRITAGLAMVVLGLTLFLEGLLLGLMPLGERVGIHLPVRGGLAAIVVFSFLLGFGSTLAEPAVAALRTVGGDVPAWEAPLLYLMLERMPEHLVMSVGVGVGIAVVIGMLRFKYGYSLKPLIFVIIPLLLFVTLIAFRNKNLNTIIGLAWDTGAVTTGAVTVPLVLALGIGLSRAVGKGEGASNGFGMVTLASAFPVLSVMVLGMTIAGRLPEPTSEDVFFSPDNRDQALLVFDDESLLRQYAFLKGSETGRQAFYDNESSYYEALDALGKDAKARHELIGNYPIKSWLQQQASDSERDRLQTMLFQETSPEPIAGIGEVVSEEIIPSMRAVIPLTALLGVVLVLLLRDRPRYLDEVLFGIALALLGMTLLTAGMRLGLTPLGAQVGRNLPQAFREDAVETERLIIQDFNPDIVFPAIDSTGAERNYFYYYDSQRVKLLEFHEERFDLDSQRYLHPVSQPPMFGPGLTMIGVGLVLLFAFGMGYGSTLAEPALNALGRTVEVITVGTVKHRSMVRAVSIGVGIGLLAGVVRILYGLPIIWLLIPPYLLLLPLTIFSEESFTGIAWDSGGVTTGTITVPLVMAMGLGIGGAVGMADGFGILALASVYPILTVMLFGLATRLKQSRIVREAEQGDDNAED